MTIGRCVILARGTNQELSFFEHEAGNLPSSAPMPLTDGAQSRSGAGLSKLR